MSLCYAQRCCAASARCDRPGMAIIRPPAGFLFIDAVDAAHAIPLHSTLIVHSISPVSRFDSRCLGLLREKYGQARLRAARQDGRKVESSVAPRPKRCQDPSGPLPLAHSGEDGRLESGTRDARMCHLHRRRGLAGCRPAQRLALVRFTVAISEALAVFARTRLLSRGSGSDRARAT